MRILNALEPSEKKQQDKFSVGNYARHPSWETYFPIVDVTTTAFKLQNPATGNSRWYAKEGGWIFQ